jgi:hypothetical protein
MPYSPPPPPPPASFPLPFPNPIATTSTPRNPPHLPEGYPLGYVPHPQQGELHHMSPRESLTTHPHFHASAHVPALTLNRSHSSSPPRPSTYFLLSGHVSPPTFPVPSLLGGYASSHSSGPPPPSSMMQRAATLPITGQVHYAQPAPYQNVPASGIAQQSSHSGVRMPESDRDVSGGRNYRAYIIHSVHAKTTNDS